ncbi:MAG: adenosylcobinamide-GDP ribazoletransferase [Kangiellaceae bacterium]
MEKQTLNKQLNLVLIAIAFFTRIPVPKSVDFSQQNLNHASRYFSLVGWLIGILCSLVLVLSSSIFTMEIAIIISMVFSVFLTGCFHEDGLADTCDGFGGGWEKQQKLSIMKDSRLGTYGAVSIWFALSFKLLLLVQIYNVSIQLIMFAIIVAHVLSRSFSTLMIYFLPYVSDEEQSKVKPLAEKLSSKDLLINLSIGLASLVFIFEQALYVLFFLSLAFFTLKYLFQKQIGGITGDTLGAAQQVSELVVYLVLMASLSQSGATL